MGFRVRTRNATEKDDDNATKVEISGEFTAPSETVVCWGKRCFFYKSERGPYWMAFIGQVGAIVHFAARA